jgi:hypothetical protein
MRFGQSTPSLKACCINAAINARRFDIGQTVPGVSAFASNQCSVGGHALCGVFMWHSARFVLEPNPPRSPPKTTELRAERKKSQPERI